MATKKVVKRIVKRVKQAPVTEVFATEQATPETVVVPRTKVDLYVNGQSKGAVKHEGMKLGEFVIQQAQQYGIRTFSAYVDGQKVTTAASGKSLATVGRVEIVAKDSRG